MHVTPKATIMCPQSGDPLISQEEEDVIRYGVGMILYFL
jgi:hypothetical protein